ncbi:S-layer homology domain-containing protein [Planococcus sp. CAU13]|uniref:S-layer homology domain-containing protein n=1 Tax=Planococcus sp. CAU13 TaxID=1541197 RepID=UPI0006920A6F|nr:S-layer homology domain-containing protein [Planococcus sp. CAU13]
MKKVIGILLTVLLLLSIVSPASAASFKDVTLYKDEIGFLVDKKIIKGYPDGTFKPTADLNRLNAVQMILREKGITDFTAPNPNFTDIKPGNYGYEEVAKAVQLGFISGKTAKDGSKFFDAGGTLTRGQMAKILSEAYNLKANDGFTFSDVSATHWAKDYISRLATANITTGYEDGTFKPESKLQRAHFAVFMARQLNDAFKPAPLLDELFVTFLNVGQGDAILIEYPNGKNALVDAGRSASVIDAALKAEGVKKIDTFIATHPDADHIGGAAHVIANYGVTKVIDSGQTHTTQTFITYLETIERVGAQFVVAEIGDDLSDDPTATAEVLYVDADASDLNDGSIVFVLSHGEIDYLMTGDAGVEVEDLLIEEYWLDAEVLKVGHHGSNTSTSQAFVNEVKPLAAVISVGTNSYGHPHSEVVSRLTKAGADVYTTQSGSVAFSDNGRNLKSYNNPIKPIPAPAPAPKPTPTPIPTPAPQPGDGQTSDKLQITGKNLITEVVTVKNTGTMNVTMTGWKLVSVEGNQTFDFPSGFVLKAGASVNITAGPNAVHNPPSSLKWTGAYIWNNDGDPAALYDSAGKLIHRLP